METTTPIMMPVHLALTAWQTQNKRFTQLVASLSDEQLAREIAPGKNTGLYLIGHLIAVSDNLLPLLGFGERLYPALDNVFISNPDKSGLEKPAMADLRVCLAKVNETLEGHMQSQSAEDWLQRHTSVSEEDFAKEPHRNKLGVLISRTNHLSYHLGQIALLK
jgi:hypothetical protein